MNEPLNSTDAAVEQLLAEFLQAAERGEAPDRESFLSAHPQLAGELREFLDDQDRLCRMVEGHGRHSQDVVPASSDGASVRYFGDYELLDEIARGGMGVVYKARQVSLTRVVALKMILSGQFASADDVKRFQVEAQNAAQLDHPNIVPIYEVGRHRGHHYYTMKLVECGSLAQRVAEFAGDPRAAARLIVLVARAVQYAHDRGILHRDLKPGNILLDAQGRPQVTDFGLARRLEAEPGLTCSGAIVGSPRYMAPEQARGQRSLTVAADVWALGAILYHLLTGRPPFDSPSIMDTLHQVKEAQVVCPSSVRGAVDRDLGTICLKCLQKDPQGRYTSAAALADDLERWVRGEPVLARRVGRCQRLWRWCRRQPALAGLSGAVAASLVFGVAGITAQWIRADRAWGNAVEAQTHAEKAATDARAAQHRAEGLLGDLKAAELRLGSVHADLYRTLIRLAAAQTFDVAAANRYLDLCPKELRSWDWHYYKRLCNPIVFSPPGRTCVAYSPDGSVLATAGGETGVLIYSRSGAPQRSPARHPKVAVTTLGFSGDGRTMFSLDATQTPRTWRVGEDEVQSFPTRAVAAALSPEGDVLATVSVAPADAGILAADGSKVMATFEEVTLWDVASARPRRRLTRFAIAATQPSAAPASGPVPAIAFARKGNWLVVAGAGRIRVFGIPGGNPVPASDPADEQLRGTVTAVSRDGGWVADADLAEIRVRQLVGVGEKAESWIPFGMKRLPLTRAGTLDDGRVPTEWRVSAMDVSPDGSYLASAATLLWARRSRNRRVFVWNLEAAQVDWAAPLDGTAAVGLGFSADGRRLAAADDHSATVYLGASEADFTEFADFHDHVYGLAVSGDGRYIASSSLNGHQVRVTDLATGEHVLNLDGPPAPFSLALTHDGRTLFVPGHPSMAWDVKAHRAEPIGENDATVVALSPDESLLALGTSQGETELWNLKERRLLYRWNSDVGLYWIGFSPDGRHLALCGKGVLVWNVDRRSPSWSAPQVQAHRAAFSPDGTRLVVGSSPDVILFDAAGREIQRWKEETQAQAGNTFVLDVAFSPDGRLVATAGTNAVRLRYVTTGETVMLLRPRRSRAGGVPGVYDRPFAVKFTPDGRKLVSAWGDPGRVVVWDTAPAAYRLPLGLVPQQDISGAPLHHKLVSTGTSHPMEGR